MDLRVEYYPSPLGDLRLLTDNAGHLRALDFDNFDPPMHRLGHHCAGFDLRPGVVPRSVRAALDDYFDGNGAALACVAVAPSGTPFQRRVWALLRTIPAGETRSYGQIAAALGQPSASRAVGLANKANPVAIVVPCHRVIGANASLTGFSGGLERKRWLLAHEGVGMASEQGALFSK